MTALQAGALGGPFHASFIAAGGQLVKPLAAARAGGITLAGWFKMAAAPTGATPLLRLEDKGAALAELCVDAGALLLVAGAARARVSLQAEAGTWQWFHIAIGGGRATLSGSGGCSTVDAGLRTPSSVVLGPRGGETVFAGLLSNLAVHAGLHRAAAGEAPRDALVRFEPNARNWPVQLRQQAGLEVPQEGATLPVAQAARAALAPAAAEQDEAALRPLDGQRFELRRWQLCSALDAGAAGEALSQCGAPAGAWLDAVVPGTVLTTLIARGQVPDPAIGLNNLEITESLCRQDWWCRSEFEAPAGFDGRRAYLQFEGINYRAQVFCNGQQLGAIEGAFMRGRFDLGAVLRPGRRNAVAVRISPPPHPGIPHEQSLAGGPGANGGALAMDGPTFIATEGWDWIPGVRDRNIGLWQAVELGHTGALRLGDAQVVSHFDDDTLARARLHLTLPIENADACALAVEIELELHDLSARVPVRRATLVRAVDAGAVTLRLDGADCALLDVDAPSLWWPNGYGRPDLYALVVTLRTADGSSDTRRYRFGIRQLSYELSLVDADGALARVEADLSKAGGATVVDVRHAAIRQLDGGLWAYSLAPGAPAAALRHLPDDPLSPFLVLKVNGVRIAARGGNWGMDDWLKRVERTRLEPYFRLHRDAHMNTIRNWVGQCTEPVFFELADEYGMLVLNDFWASTQDHQMEPQDPTLFMANATDVVRRYRNHPCIAVWFGRNEGVPQPLLNEAIEAMVRLEDGTRLYAPNSREINLQQSGPWNWREPQAYYEDVARGFSTEIGTQSFPTLEAFEAFVPEADRWPISDTWAYHDWHTDENGDTAPFEAALAERFGAADSLADFERKAQMLNYESHRAIFEGMNAGLWRLHSGRLLWMSQPAWPSLQWQICSHDYDTHAAYYGVKAALEPVHAQFNLPGYALLAVNLATTPLDGALLDWELVRLDGSLCAEGSVALSLAANSVSQPFDVGIGARLEREGTLVARLRLRDAQGRHRSRNVYWASLAPAAQRALCALPRVELELSLRAIEHDADACASTFVLTLANHAGVPSLNNKLTLLDALGARVLPAYYSDNYISLLPGESVELRIDVPGAGREAAAALALRGWNCAPQTLTLTGE
ncbi:MAG: glycoside hydrolase family 2 [Pseudomonadota bacterium]